MLTALHDTAICFSSPAGADNVGAEAPASVFAAIEMVKLEVTAVAPDESVTVTRTVDDPGAVGVPEITPVNESNDKPSGRLPVVTLKLFPPGPPEGATVRENDSSNVPDNPDDGVATASVESQIA